MTCSRCCAKQTSCQHAQVPAPPACHRACEDNSRAGAEELVSHSAILCRGHLGCCAGLHCQIMPCHHLDNAVAVVVWVCDDAPHGVWGQNSCVAALGCAATCTRIAKRCSFCRWPFWVGFGVTGGLILKLSLSLTGAHARPCGSDALALFVRHQPAVIIASWLLSEYKQNAR